MTTALLVIGGQMIAGIVLDALLRGITANLAQLAGLLLIGAGLLLSKRPLTQKNPSP